MTKQKPRVAVISLVAAVLLSACALPPAPPPAQPPAQQSATTPEGPNQAAQIVNIVWLWGQLVETNPPSQLDVPDPLNYTLTFLEDGNVSIKADCNQVGGMYTVNGEKLTITLGPSTLAFCGEDSLDQQYLEALSKVDEFGVSEKRLVLYLTKDVISMGFDDGGPAR